jgi:hypothetical protein
MIDSQHQPRTASLSIRHRLHLHPCCAAAFTILLFSALDLRAQAKLPGLTDTEKTNVQTVIDNLGALLKDAAIKKAKLSTVDRDTNQIIDADTDKEVKAYGKVLDNLISKLKGDNIHSIKDLNDKPSRYKESPEAPPSHPRAAFCIEGTSVLVGNQEIPCKPGDIIIDSKFINPPGNNGKIDESTPAGWIQKWTLLHMLVHEKWHERMINEQKDELMKRWGGWSKDRKDANLKEAIERGTTPERHAEVYEAQKNILRLKLAALKAEKKKCEDATPQDGACIARVDKQIEWIEGKNSKPFKKGVKGEQGDEGAIKWLETKMKSAVADHDLEFASCGGAGDLLNGTIAMYMVSLDTGYWRLDVDLRAGKMVDLRAPETFFFGDLYEEDPIPNPPSLYVEMPERVFTGLDVQPDPCDFLHDEMQKGHVVTGKTFNDIQPFLPKLVLEDEPPAQETLVGIILPNDIQQGDHLSATVTTDPKRFEKIPALDVIKTTIPLTPDADGNPTFHSVKVTIGNETPQPAQDGMTTVTTPGQTTLGVHVTVPNSPRPLLETTVPVTPSTAPQKPTTETQPSDFTAPSVCIPNSVHIIHGVFSGNSRQTTVTLDDAPAKILAESPRAVIWSVPKDTLPGSHRLTVRDGDHAASFKVASISIQMSADRTVLKRGESTPFRAVVRGLEDLPASGWTATAPFDLEDEAGLRNTAPGFHIPAKGEEGALLLNLKNLSPGTITVPGWQNEATVLTLRRGDFSNGQYVYTGTIVSRVSGSFSISGIVTPFLAEQSGEPVH